MSLQAKVISLILAIFFAYGALDYAVQQFFVLPSFQALEHEEAQKDLDRVIQAIERETRYLASSATDWATWDETYRFVQDRNAAYRESNLNSETLKNLKANFMGILDATGQVAWQLAYDLHANAAIALPELANDRWPADHPLVALSGMDAEVRGVLLTALGPLLIAARPVLTTNREGPVRGSVVLGRFLDSATISAQTQVSFNFAVLDGRTLDPEETAAFQVLGNSGQTLLREDANVNRIYRVLPDLFGKPALLLEVKAPRTISARGHSAINYALLSLLGAGLMILAGLIVGLRRVVLAPLQKLTAYAVAAGHSHDLAPLPWEARHDELGVLEREFSQMIERLVKTRNALIEQSYQLGVAEASARTRAVFLSNISHEMRTPMNVIIGFSYIGLQANPAPALRNYLTEIDAAARTLQRLIDDLLDFSRVETGELRLEPTLFNLEAVINEVAEAIRPGVRVKGLEWITELDSRLPSRLIGDPLRLSQVLRHLADNAVKFTAAGTVRLSCEIVDEPDQTGIALRFMVQDTGIGLSAEQQARLFQPFTQGDSSTTRQFGGAGLGLAMSQRLVQLMGGRIEVASAPGRGSAFWFVARFSVAHPEPGSMPDAGLGLNAPEGGIAPAPVVDQAALESAVAQLAEKLHMQDFGSGEQFRRLRALLPDPALTSLLDPLAQHLEDFQFDSALAQLQNLAEHLRLEWRE